MIHIKSKIAILFAKIIHKKESKWISNPIKTQEKTLKKLVRKASNTKFGKEHHFDKIHNYEDFKNNVPIRNYEALRKYINLAIKGKQDILWPGKPLYWAMTSGTTSGSKYIPLTKDAIPSHINSARNALLNYIFKTGKSDFINGKMIFIQGNPELEEENGIKSGRLSGIVAHFVPKYLQKNRMPSWQTNCIEDWEEKIYAIAKETLSENMTLVSGIPPWLIMYFEKLIELSGKNDIQSIFPNLNLIVTGGVNYEPYRKKINNLIGKKLDVIQTYPASEGFIAYQINNDEDDLLLLLDNGIFYEFVEINNSFNENPRRLSLAEVELETDYILIINSNAGLWGYNIGDTVRFTSLSPHKIIISGRIKHFTSAFGEHVIAHEVETALEHTLEKTPANISEFTVAPQVTPEKGLPYHEWFIEFDKAPEDLEAFSLELDKQLQSLNSYYFDLISGGVLRPLIIRKVSKDGFSHYMKSVGKLGEQNKIPRLSNDRKIADAIYKLNIII